MVFFGETKYKWVEIDKAWWTREPESIEQLRKWSINFYDGLVLSEKRIIDNAMKLK